MAKALCLSGGAAQGSFQMGAIKCLYTRFGFRPDLIVGTSVGAINGVKLAEGKTPAEQLVAMQELEKYWWSRLTRADFFTPRPELVQLVDMLAPDPPGPPGGRMALGGIFEASAVLLALPLVHVAAGIAALALLPDIRKLLHDLQTLNSLAKLTPIENLMRTGTGKLDVKKVAAGTPVFLATVALESGRLRFVTGQGTLVEEDGVSAVVSALTPADLEVGSMSGVVKDRAKAALADFTTIHARVVFLVEDSANSTTPVSRRIANHRELRDLLPRGDDTLRRLREATTSHADVTAKVDLVSGTLASSALPGIFEPPKLGAEHYVDGGVREVIPVEMAIRRGADTIVAVVASATRSHEHGSFEKAGVLGCLLRGVLDITNKEVIDTDVDVAAPAGTTIKQIMPSFNVHDGMVIDPSLLEISMHYGFMRAGDVMTAHASDDRRRDAFALSDALAWLRIEQAEDEEIGASPGGAEHARLARLRVRKWVIRQLVFARRARALPLPDLADLWAFEWERNSRPSPKWVMGIPNPWVSYITTSMTTPAASLADFAPDDAAVEDRATGATFDLVRGAAFAMTPPTSNVAPIVLPPRAADFLPRIPPGQNILVEQGNPQQWYCDGKRRYAVNSPAILAALGMAGAPVATVPPGGLAQIPDGGPPYWAGKLVATDSAHVPITVWDPAQREGSQSEPVVYLYNRGAGDILVDWFRFEGLPPGAGLTVSGTPGIVAPGKLVAMKTSFKPTVAGVYSGSIDIRSDDALVPRFLLPVEVTVLPTGAHPTLTFAPPSLELAGKVLQTVVLPIIVTNTSTVAALFDRVAIEDESRPGTFVISSLTTLAQLGAGQSAEVRVTATPDRAGRSTAKLALDLRAILSTGQTYQQTFRVPLAATATGPKIRLRAEPPRIIRMPPRPLPSNRGVPLPGPIPGPDIPLTEVADPSPFVVDLGVVHPGTLASGHFFIGNTGGGPLTVSSIGLRSGGAYTTRPAVPFVVQPDTWTEVAFALGTGLTSPGGRAASTFGINSDDPLTPESLVNVSVGVSGPRLTISTDFLDFGVVPAGDAADKVLTLGNVGSDPLVLSALRWVDKPFTADLAAGSTLPLTMAPGTSVEVTVHFPAGMPIGDYVDSVGIVSNNADALVMVSAKMRVR